MDLIGKKYVNISASKEDPILINEVKENLKRNS